MVDREHDALKKSWLKVSNEIYRKYKTHLHESLEMLETYQHLTMEPTTQIFGGHGNKITKVIKSHMKIVLRLPRKIIYNLLL